MLKIFSRESIVLVLPIISSFTFPTRFLPGSVHLPPSDAFVSLSNLPLTLKNTVIQSPKWCDGEQGPQLWMKTPHPRNDHEPRTLVISKAPLRWPTNRQTTTYSSQINLRGAVVAVGGEGPDPGLCVGVGVGVGVDALAAGEEEEIWLAAVVQPGAVEAEDGAEAEVEAEAEVLQRV